MKSTFVEVSQLIGAITGRQTEIDAVATFNDCPILIAELFSFRMFSYSINLMNFKFT